MTFVTILKVVAVQQLSRVGLRPTAQNRCSATAFAVILLLAQLSFLRLATLRKSELQSPLGLQSCCVPIEIDAEVL